MTSSAVSMVRFTPAAVLPAQQPSSRVAIQPEKRLLLAMLEDALATALRTAPIVGRRRRNPRAQARDWIFSDDASWPFSFVNVCGYVGFDPAYVRRSLLLCDSPRHIRSGARRLSGSRTRIVPLAASGA